MMSKTPAWIARCISPLFFLSAFLSANAFESIEVEIDNPAENSHLEGTLTRPAGRPLAALVLATGSGPQDRDETVFGHKPFKAIAEALSAEGYAVLRLDDRGVGGSTGPTENATTANFVSDITRAVNWLDSALTDVPVGVLGHSEGGQIALRVGASSEKCRFIITLAGPAWKGDSLIMAQCRALSVKALGRWDGEAAQRRILDVAMSQLPAFSASPIIAAEISSTLGDAAGMPQAQEFVSAQTKIVLTPWYRDFLRYDPHDDIVCIKIPWLALNGDKDCQVPVENLATIAELCPSATVVSMPSHNHLFQKASTGLPNEYAGLQEDISQETIDEILKFLTTFNKIH